MLVATQYSLISAGTERALVDIGKASLLGKARARPDLARKVIEAARTEGVLATYRKVRSRLDEPMPLGYSSAGVVIEACDDAPAAPGDLVACAGAGFASHAEVVAVPRTLVARVPEGVDARDAAYATVAAIALHGVRLCEAGLGDVVAVVGLGLVGQLAVELVQAAGCVPIGFDLNPARVQMVREFGVAATSDPAELAADVQHLTSGRGVDAALITAASRDAAPLATATEITRDRAVVCIVGDVPISSPRAVFYEKELRLVVSRSYGPGRYDPAYEEGGQDYPASYVRWTEGRNLAEVLRLMADGRLRPSRLTTHTFNLDRAPEAFALLQSPEPSLGILLSYSGSATADRVVRLSGAPSGSSERPRVGVIGAGSFARGVLLPALTDHVVVGGVANATGVSARAAAERLKAPLATTDPAELLGKSNIDAVLVATRHDSHAALAAQALAAGKHVFVEKPLAIRPEELDSVREALANSRGILMVGFNRRFSPFARRTREGLGGRGPLVVTIRANAGRLPRGHWTHDPEIGGGRIVGEVCHFVDLACFLCGSTPTQVSATAVGGGSEPREDNLSATFRMADGSVATIIYTAFGDPALAKERIEVVGEGGAAVIDDFTRLHLYTGGRERVVKGRRDKGHSEEMRVFADACRDGRQPWPVEEMLEVTRWTFAIRDAVAGART